METLIKNVPHAQPFTLKGQVEYEAGKVVSLTLAQQPGAGITLFAFDAGEAISTHAAPGDAMATILEGTAQSTIDGVPHTLNAGEAIIMPAGIPHAVQAVTAFKMYLVVVKTPSCLQKKNGLHRSQNASMEPVFYSNPVSNSVTPSASSSVGSWVTRSTVFPMHRR